MGKKNIMVDIIFDAETVGVDHHSPSFEVLFNGFMLEEYIDQGVGSEGILDAWQVPPRLVAHNLKFDAKCLIKQGHNISHCVFYDTQVALHLLRPNLDSFKLEDLAQVLYDHPNYKGLVNFKDNEHVDDISLLKIYNYHDLRFTKQLQKLTEPKLKAQGQWPLFLMMMDFVKELSYTEMKGVGVDLKELNRQGAIFTIKENKCLEELRNYAAIDWLSPKQIRDLFISKGFKLPKTKKKIPSVNEASLLKICDKDDGEARDIAKLLLEFRGAHKQLSTYIVGFKELLHDGIYYPDYYLLLATGRLSEHFIQVMPRSDVSEFKKCIVSKFKRGILLECDWGQLELRLNAEMSGDSALIKDLLGGIDLHAETLARFPFLPNRTRAKNVNFSVFFGGKGYTLINEYGLSEEQAKDIRYDLLEVRYPGMNDYFTKCEYQIMTKGYVESFYGRRGYTNVFTEAYNRPIQGAGSDWNKIMLSSLNSRLKGWQSHVCADIHDSLIIDIHPEEKQEVTLLIKDTYSLFDELFHHYFEQELKMKYVSEYKIGKNLYEMEGLR